MSLRSIYARMIGLALMVLLGTGVTSLNAFGTSSQALQAMAAGQDIGSEAKLYAAESQLLNPHSDLIFRATGATSCRDCHRIGKDGGLSPQPIDNELVRKLRNKAKGIHGPGRFADCLRCHAGGRKGVEKY